MDVAAGDHVGVRAVEGVAELALAGAFGRTTGLYEAGVAWQARSDRPSPRSAETVGAHAAIRPRWASVSRPCVHSRTASGRSVTASEELSAVAGSSTKASAFPSTTGRPRAASRWTHSSGWGPPWTTSPRQTARSIPSASSSARTARSATALPWVSEMSAVRVGMASGSVRC